jgi:Cysteine rich repeat
MAARHKKPARQSLPIPLAPPRAELAVLRQACGRDYQANCAGVRPGGGQVIACLAANQARLSPGCQRALAMAKPGL